MSGQLLGKQVQPRALCDLAYRAGIHDARELVRAVAVALSESQGYDRAFNDNLSESGDTLSRDVGIWEINIPASAIGTQLEEDLYVPSNNAQAMFILHKSRGWQPWAAYNSGVYLHDGYLRRACLGVMNWLAEDLVVTAKSLGQVPTTRVPMINLHELKTIYP